MQAPLVAMARDNLLTLRPATALPRDYPDLFARDRRPRVLPPCPAFMHEIRDCSSNGRLKIAT